MRLLFLLLILILVSLLIPFSSSFVPTTSYFLNCGSTSNTSFSSDSPPRNFTPDSPFLVSKSNSSSVSNPNPPPDSSALYSTARVFTGSTASYRFKLSSHGTHFLRLHFLPFPAQKYDLAAARFNVSALGRILLLSDFSAPEKTQLPLIKEYLLPVDSGELLLTFTPNSSPSVAFVSAIEVFTAPANLLSSGNQLAISAPDAAIGQVAEQALETVYRINVGGPEVTPANDTLWRTWLPDDKYLYSTSVALESNTTRRVVYSGQVTTEIAPEKVYDTARTMNIPDTMPISNPDFDFNLTWSFPVTPAYKYFVRLHFCDFVSRTPEELSFDVYISERLAWDLRPGNRTTQLAEAFFMDFATEVPSSNLINVSIGRSSTTWTTAANAILNGLEIMKVNNSVGSLNGTVNPEFKIGQSRKKKGVPIAVLVAAPIVGGLIALASAALIFVRGRHRAKAQPVPGPEPKESPVSWSPYQADATNSLRHPSEPTEGTAPFASARLHLGLHFSLMELKLATSDFDQTELVGVGGFGKVYKGVLRDGTKIAVKRGTAGSKQGHPEFQNEILVLSKIRHRHLVSLIGYCDEQSEMILVYEYMENGPLRDYLYGSDKPCLSWKQRLEICIGAARGLHYLHTGYSENIIHRDVKSTNILLGENYLAKVSDFGLSRLGPSYGETHVTTNNIKGTFGYLDPEYFKTLKLTDKSDVYSFGVMLFEVLCARPVIDQGLPREQQNVAEWALQWQRRGQLEKITDPRLVGKIDLNSLRKFGETAEKCVAEYAVDRPAMGDVLWNLEYALQLQVTSLRREPYEDSGNQESQIPAVLMRWAPWTSVDVTTTRTSEEQSDVTSSKVFSQLITDEGR